MANAYERLQRLSELKRDGLITDAEFEARRTTIIDAVVDGEADAVPPPRVSGERLAARRDAIMSDYEAFRGRIGAGQPSSSSSSPRTSVQVPEYRSPGPSTAKNGRNLSHVLVGALGGISCGVLFIGALLVWVPKERRGDRLFGAWFGVAAGGLILAIAFASIANGRDGSGQGTAPQSVAPASAPTEVPSLLTASEAMRLVQNDYFTSSSKVSNGGWRLCDQARYQAVDRTWVVTCKFTAEQAGPVLDIKTYLLDDRTGRKVR